jgi:hypothetical protein
MPRYIELDEAIRTSNRFIHNQVDAVDMAIALEEKSTEDVVPRAEVEKAKQEVAMEIFEVLGEVFLTIPLKDGEKATIVDFKRYAELKKKYIGE